MLGDAATLDFTEAGAGELVVHRHVLGDLVVEPFEDLKDWMQVVEDGRGPEGHDELIFVDVEVEFIG